jgi:hypothetical protein
MAGDRHKRTFRTGLRPDEALYKRVLAEFHANGRTMNDEFDWWLLLLDSPGGLERWLRYRDGQPDEPPATPGDDASRLCWR